MAVNALDSERVLLLILTTKKQLFPLSPEALTLANTTRRKLAQDYKEALILDRGGTLRRIEHITVLGPDGDSVGQKLLSWLANSWRVDVRLSEPLSYQIEKLKQQLYACIQAHPYFEFPATDETRSKQDIAEAIQKASSVTEIFDILRMPPLEDCLDVL